MEAVSLSYKEIDSVPFTLTRPHPGGSEQTAWGTWRHEAPHSTAFCNESKLMTPEGTEQEARSHLQSRCFSRHTEGVRPEPWAGAGAGALHKQNTTLSTTLHRTQDNGRSVPTVHHGCKHGKAALPCVQAVQVPGAASSQAQVFHRGWRLSRGEHDGRPGPSFSAPSTP